MAHASICGGMRGSRDARDGARVRGHRPRWPDPRGVCKTSCLCSSQHETLLSCWSHARDALSSPTIRSGRGTRSPTMCSPIPKTSFRRRMKRMWGGGCHMPIQQKTCNEECSRTVCFVLCLWPTVSSVSVRDDANRTRSPSLCCSFFLLAREVAVHFPPLRCLSSPSPPC